jgi:hypothetical protein
MAVMVFGFREGAVMVGGLECTLHRLRDDIEGN